MVRGLLLHISVKALGYMFELNSIRLLNHVKESSHSITMVCPKFCTYINTRLSIYGNKKSPTPRAT